MSVVSDIPSPGKISLVPPSVEDVVNLIAARNADRLEPIAPKGPVARRIKGLIGELTSLLDARPKTAPIVDDEVGEGLGEPLAPGEGLRRLRAYATPIAIEGWAGEVVGPSELERRYGVSRSTLHDWHRRGAVIGLLAGQRKHVFPLAQFIDGRPIEGLTDVLAAVGSPRTAWLWLVETHPSLRGRRPLDRLRESDVDTVVDLAERDFGPS